MRAYYHLPGLFEFYELYRSFLPLFIEHREYFYDWCEIGSVYGAPADCLWGGGRVGFGEASPSSVASLMAEYGISSRLTFSNSLITSEHLSDTKCNRLCSLFEHNGDVPNGVIVHSDLLASYIKPDFDVWVELGLQSAHNRTLEPIHRGHTAEQYKAAVDILHSKGIKVASHLILGLPGESFEDMMASVDFINALQPEAVKLHDLNITYNTELYNEYLK